MAAHTETHFEMAIEYSLTHVGGYTKGDPADFDAGLCLFSKDAELCPILGDAA